MTDDIQVGLLYILGHIHAPTPEQTPMLPCGLPGMPSREAIQKLHTIALACDWIHDQIEKNIAAEEDIGTQLLTDVFAIFNHTDVDRIASEDLVASLRQMEDRPWSRMNNSGRPLSKNQMARLLGQFEIQSHSIRNGARVYRGYARVAFEDAWAQHLSHDEQAQESLPFVESTPEENGVADQFEAAAVPLTGFARWKALRDVESTHLQVQALEAAIEVPQVEDLPPPSRVTQRRKSVYVDGVAYKNLSAAARARSLNEDAVRSRVKRGWTIAQALELTLPPRGVVVDGVAYKTLADACRAVDADYQDARSQIRRGMTAQQVLGS